MTHYDLVIVGGGLVGAGLAAALRETTLSIALIDARLPDNNDPRLFALNASSCQFLKNIQVWPQLVDYAAPIHQVHVSRRGYFGAVRLNREDVSANSLGHVIPAHYIEKILNELLLMQANVTLYRPATLKALQREDKKVVLTLTSGDSESSIHLQADLIIGADGAESVVRQQAGIAAHYVDYAQSALVTRTMLQRSHENIAYERFTQEGAVAMLPLVGQECATIWSADKETINTLMQLPDDVFLERLQKEFGYRLGRLQKVSKRHMFPLRMVKAEKAFDDNILLLGNAAHTLHPIAAQGFNLALYEVAAVVEGIANQASLAEIMQRVAAQLAASISVSHFLPTLFNEKNKWVSILSQLGMLGFDVATPLKRSFMTRMMGKTGKVPSLLLGATR